MSRPALVAVFFLLTLIPLTVDHALDFRVGFYNLRLSYLGAALLLTSFFLSSTGRAAWRDWIRRVEFKLFLGFLMCGLIGTLGAVYVERAALFWTRAALATLIVPPCIAWAQNQKLKSIRMADVFGIYSCILGLVVIWDQLAILCNVPFLAIGRIAGADIPRPHAWYQEPNYLACFQSLVAVWATLQIGAQAKTFWKPFHSVVRAIALLSILASTSRVGVIMVALVMTFMVANRALSSWKRLNRSSLILIVFGLVVGVSSLKFATNIRTNDESVIERLTTLRGALSAFQDRPIFGVGPANLGAYLVTRHPTHPSLHDRPRRGLSREFLSNDPFTKDYFSEVASEWGLAGLLFLFCALALWLGQGVTRSERLLTFGILCLVFATSQTIARFDYWFAYAMIGAAVGSRRFTD